MFKILSYICALIFLVLPLKAENANLQSLVGQWHSPNYLFIMNSSYKATVVILANKYQSFVFNGIYTLEKDSVLHISINEIKTCTPGDVYSKKGFTKTASSRFVFSADLKKDKLKILSLKPKEIVIDGNNSDGYFEPMISLQKK